MEILQKIKMKYAVPFVLMIIAILYIFFTYNSWLTSNCIAPLGADIKHHIANVTLFTNQIKLYGIVYPVEYLRDISGYYWYTKNWLPIIIPSLFTLFLPLNTAFFLVYLFLYAIVTLILYMLIKGLTDEFTGFIIALFFLLSNLSNMIFSVGGNYQFLFGLLFFFLAMHYLFQYSKSSTKKNLLLLTISIVALGMSYTFSLIFFLSFAFIYAIVTKQLTLIKVLVICIFLLGFFLVPSFLTGSYLNVTNEDNFPSPSELLRLYILPTSFFGWIYQSTTHYQGHLDFNQGIHLYLAGFISIIYLILKKIKTKEATFINLHLLVMVGWVLLGFASRLDLFSFLKNFFATGVNPERLMMHVALAFLFVVTYALYKFTLQWKSFVVVFLLALLTLGKYVLSSKFLFILLGVGVILGLKGIKIGEKVQHHLLIISSLILLLLLFPLTGKVETTNLQPRVDYIILPNIQNYINENDTFYFLGGWSLQESIIACTRAHSIIQTDKDQIISGLNDNIDIFNQTISTKDALEMRGITKLSIVGDQLVEGKKISKGKISHLIKWFGQPKLMQLKSRIRGRLVNYYPLFIFDIPKKETPYKIEIKNPINIIITNIKNQNNLILNLEWHPWWKAKDIQNNKEIQIDNKEGLIHLVNVVDIETITLDFSIKYFVFGFLLSLVGFWLLIKEIK